MLRAFRVRRCGNLQLSRFVSSAQNNLTYAMGLEPNSEHAKRTAVILDHSKAITYSELGQRVGSYVALLHSKYSLQRGDRLLGRTQKNLDALALYLATLRLGAIYVPLNPGYTPRETTHFVKDSEPRIFVTCDEKGDAQFADRVKHIVSPSVLASESRETKPDYGVENVEEREVAVICYTSGTTGLPKGAMQTHGGLAWNGYATIDCWQFTSDDVQLHQLPFYHVHGLFISLNPALLSHSSLIFRPKFTVEDALEWMPKSTLTMGVPTYYSRLVANESFGPEHAKNMRLFVCGSAPLSLPVWHEFLARTKKPIVERYGMTEATVITTNPLGDGKQVAGSVGKILRGGEMRISKEGIVEVKMPSVFKGYWRNPEKTKAEFTNDGFFKTGDIGRIDDEGNLWILGRGKDLIISGGLNVYPKEVEDVIDADAEVDESAVIGVPHPDFGEAVVAICVLKSGHAKKESEEQLSGRIRPKLANYKRPKCIIFLKELPRNFMGKVQKNVLRDKYRNLFQ